MMADILMPLSFSLVVVDAVEVAGAGGAAVLAQGSMSVQALKSPPPRAHAILLHKRHTNPITQSGQPE